MPFQSQWQQYDYNRAPSYSRTPAYSSGGLTGASIPETFTRTVENFVVMGQNRPTPPASISSARGQNGHSAECWNNQRMSLWNNYTSGCLSRVAELQGAGYPGPYKLPLKVEHYYLPPNGHSCPCSGQQVVYRMHLDIRAGGTVAYWA